MINNFEKSYTRDYSMLVEEAWYHALTEGIKSKLGIEIAEISTIFYMNEGVIEIWENKEVINKFITKLLETVDINSIKKILEEYVNKSKRVELIIRKRNINTTEELVNFIEDMFEIMIPWAILYLIGIDERISEEIKIITKEFREKDSFFDNCDEVIRNSLSLIYPQLKNYETTIVLSDLRTEIPNLELLKERKNNFVVIPKITEEINTLTEFARHNQDFNFQFEAFDLESNEITGQMASTGKAIGQVKIIKRKEQMIEMEEGKILVTPMTTPEFVPVMEKAAAFVTDEGGILCHAAIVAREMKKPCIIGTKVATELLNDGDLIEVDADNGIIRIIEKVGLRKSK